MPPHHGMHHHHHHRHHHPRRGITVQITPTRPSYIQPVVHPPTAQPVVVVMPPNVQQPLQVQHPPVQVQGQPANYYMGGQYQPSAPHP